MLNQEYEWNDVRYQINRRISYDVDLSFDGRPAKELLPPGTMLYRLDSPIVFGIFMKVWWMKEAAFRRIFARVDSPSALRQEWQNSLALRKPGKGEAGKLGGRTGDASTRTQVLVILTTQPVFAWVGIASPLFHRAGGEEQVYLPNLAHGSGPNRSDHARLLRTYTLPTT
ncbi:MAG: hypothetical protein ABSE56_08520 [Bryobacteraceae bacterium]|jgi:hypothetical protein